MEEWNGGDVCRAGGQSNGWPGIVNKKGRRVDVEVKV